VFYADGGLSFSQMALDLTDRAAHLCFTQMEKENAT
jgi:hypothetical protein